MISKLTNLPCQSIIVKSFFWCLVLGYSLANSCLYAQQPCQVSISPAQTMICPDAPVVLSATVTGNSGICQLSDVPPNLQSGLVAWYPFCGNANDESGNGNHGTVIGATLAPDRFGNPNNAYYFDGISSSIYIPNANNLNVDSITIVAFINPAPGLTQAIIVAKSDSNNATHYSYHFNYEGVWAGNQGLAAAWGNGNCNPPSSINASYVFAPSGLFIPNQWSMTAMTVDQTGFCTLYQNQNIVGSGATGIPVGSCNHSLGSLRIGGVWWPGHPQRFRGYIDDVFIFNRPLSQSEIQQLNSLTSSNSSPISYQWSTGDTTQSITVSPVITTTYSVLATIGNSTCTSQATINTISAPITFTGSTIVNGNQIVTYTAQSVPGLPYNWSVSAGLIISGQGTPVIQVQWMNADTLGVVSLNVCRYASSQTVQIKAQSSSTGSSPCFKSQLPLNLQNGLVAFYPFCGNANDESGNGYHGTTYGSLLSPDRFGNSANAYYFNGNGDHIVVPNAPALNLDSGTFIAFIRPDPGSTEGLILAKSDSNNATQYSYHLKHEGIWQNQNGFFGAWGDGNCALPSSINGTYVFAPSGLFPGNTWDMVTMTVDGTGFGQLYRNNQLLSSTLANVPMGNCNHAASSLRIGGPWWTGHLCWFKGYIDDVYIYNRVLSTSELNQLINLNTVTNIETEIVTDFFTIYPNPANNYFTIQFLSLDDRAKVKVYTATGAELYNRELSAGETEHVIKLDYRGPVFVKMEDLSGKVYFSKVLMID
jgi:hypothetical protein